MPARITISLVLWAIAALADPAAALATLSLTSTATPSFSANLNAGDQTATYTVPMTAADTSSGSSSGWNLTITSTQLATAGGTHTLATTASKITAVTSSCATSCTRNPTNSIGYPLTIPAASSPPTAVKFFNAAANTGQGTFTITPTVQVTIPQNSYAGTYTSTLTLAILSGP